jgi:hypothetical protein
MDGAIIPIGLLALLILAFQHEMKVDRKIAKIWVGLQRV